MGVWGILFPQDTRAPDSFPNTELVFTTTSGVGFVNADGSDPAYFHFSAKIPGMILGTSPAAIARPVITENNRVLIAKVATYINYAYMTNHNFLILWKIGELPLFCSQWGEQDMPLLSKDQTHIFITSEQGMALYNLDDCGTDEPPSTVYENMSGVISPNFHYLAYATASPTLYDDRIIIIRDLDNDQERIITMADFPAWSRDSQWLAYTGTDGIYIVNISKNTDPVRIAFYPNPVGKLHPTYSHINQLPPPEPAWSPDGKWLVYHKLTVDDNGIQYPDYHSIVKVNVESGQEIKIIDGGMYPYWRWPAEIP